MTLIDASLNRQHACTSQGKMAMQQSKNTFNDSALTDKVKYTPIFNQ